MDPSTVFELRTYTASPGKLEALQDRFRNHTIGLFEKHGFGIVGFWLTDEPEESKRLVYLLRFPSREAAAASWESFRNDPEWIDAKAKTEVDGILAPIVESVYLKATDFSALS